MVPVAGAPACLFLATLRVVAKKSPSSQGSAQKSVVGPGDLLLGPAGGVCEPRLGVPGGARAPRRAPNRRSAARRRGPSGPAPGAAPARHGLRPAGSLGRTVPTYAAGDFGVSRAADGVSGCPPPGAAPAGSAHRRPPLGLFPGSCDGEGSLARPRRPRPTAPEQRAQWRLWSFRGFSPHPRASPPPLGVWLSHRRGPPALGHLLLLPRWGRRGVAERPFLGGRGAGV